MSDFEFRGLRTQTLLKLGWISPYAILGDENGVIIHPYIPGDIWVRPLFANGYGKAFRARGPIGTSIKMTPGTPVKLQVIDNRLQVVNLDVAAAAVSNVDMLAANTSKPNSGGFIGQQSIVTLLVIPSSPPSLIIYVKSWSPIQGGIAYDFPGSSIDLTSLVPSAGNMRYVMIFLKSDYATLEAIGSTARGQTDVPLGLADRQECINGRSTGSTPIWAIKLIGGQTSIQQSDIDSGVDERQSINTDATNSGAGGATFATPAIALGSSAAAGTANSVIRSDSTIAAFDATNPHASAPGDAAAVGAAAFAARRDHVHARESTSDFASYITGFRHLVEGRLTLTSGTPITGADVTGATTVYFTPFRGNLISLYDGTKWVTIAFAEKSVAVPSSTNTLYDVFGYLSSGDLALETLAWNLPTNGTITNATNATPIVVTYTGTDPANDDTVEIAGVGGNTAANGVWRVRNINTGAKTFELHTLANANSTGNGAFTTNGTWQAADKNQTRATALATQDGVYVKSGDATRLYLGTIRTTTTSGQCEDSLLRRFCINYYNAVRRRCHVFENTNHTYNAAPARPWNDNTATRFEFIYLGEDTLNFSWIADLYSNTAGSAAVVREPFDQWATVPLTGSAIVNAGTSEIRISNAVPIGPEFLTSGYHFSGISEAAGGTFIGTFVLTLNMGSIPG